MNSEDHSEWSEKVGLELILEEWVRFAEKKDFQSRGTAST